MGRSVETVARRGMENSSPNWRNRRLDNSSPPVPEKGEKFHWPIRDKLSFLLLLFFFLSDKESLEKEKVTRERETAFEHVLFASLMRTLFVPWISNPWREFQANIYRKIFASTTYCKLKRKNIKRNTCFNNEKEKRKFENLRKSIPHFPFLLPNARSNHLSITV